MHKLSNSVELGFVMETVYILGTARTPMGGLQGAFADAPASQLGGVAIAAALEAAQVSPEQVDELLMGCVLPQAKVKHRRGKQGSQLASGRAYQPPRSTKCVVLA